MHDIDIIPVQGFDFHFSPLRWPFAADRRTEIEDYFTHLQRARPELWNGHVLLLRDFKISDATLGGTLFEADYASFIAWRDWGYPDREVRACFAMGALLSSDGAITILLVLEEFTFRLACPTRGIFSSVVSILIATSGARSPRKPVLASMALQLISGWLCSQNKVSP
jgi:hypothetical protein